MLVDQIPALVGVVLGAAGAMASSALTDRLRWRREQGVRWDQRRLDAFIAFAATLKEISTIAFRMSSAYRPRSGALPLSREAGLELLVEANIRRTQDWESLLLLGDEATVRAGARWRDAVRDLEMLARAETWDAATWRPAVDVMNEARDAFHVAARHGLGIHSGSVAQAASLVERVADEEGTV
ncbi:hypothetical protein [Dactylosporangium sp. NPDC051541]|uniref:hypothetical protein n=1 Tax=Dactylosporangium sp. NPDC051541 TaxID=3363977 RepID=UPI0037B7BBDE